ncbi:MAG: ABC transporter permease [Planctomycetes bacterium]|nr:ABC transporter permease [Planctomycetota bacterium]
MNNLGATVEPSALPDKGHSPVGLLDERQCTVDPSDPLPCELDPPETVIEAKPGWHLIDLSALWRYRELLYFLIWRDVKVRYKQTVLGATWAILQPLVTMVVFSLFFSRLSPSHSTGVPYPLFVFAGLLPWTFFSNAITSASQSIVSNHHLVTKVYFPRLIIPLASVGAGLLDFLIASTMLLPLMFYFGVCPSMGLLLTPFLVVGLVVAALGVGTLLAALTVAYRDFRYVVPFLTQLWMFATPCIYMQADAVLSPHWRLVLPFNPAYGLIANFRAASLGTAIDLSSLAISSAVSVLLLIVGCLYFRRVESSFADVI